MLVVDATAPAHRVRAVARDALGWLRVLGGGEALSVLVSDRGLALLQNRAGITMTSTVVATHRPGAGRLRVRALGETITNIDAEGRHACVETSSAAGRLVAPARFESPERLALRRALDAVTTGTDPGDLAELFADAALVPRILGA